MKKIYKQEEIPARAGEVLLRIIKEQNRTQAEVAGEVGITPQKLNDLISGSRRFSARTSLLIEKVLAIDETGFFYKLQSEYDIYLEYQKRESK